jgi:hypothetical protein
MAKGDAMQSELNEMRTQIEAMAADAERDRANVGSEVGRDEPSPEKETESEKPGAPEGAGGNLSAQIQELIEVINRDLRDSNPVTLLAVFAIGVVTGRLLPR